MKHKTFVRAISLFATIIIVVALGTYLISSSQAENFVDNEPSATFQFTKSSMNPNNADVSISWSGINGNVAITYVGPERGNLSFLERNQYTIRNLRPGPYKFTIISYKDGLPRVDIDIPVSPTGTTIVSSRRSSLPPSVAAPTVSPSSQSWSSVNAPQLKQVSHSGANVCGVTNSDVIMCKFGSQDWKTIPGLLKHISVDGDRACGMNGGNEIFCTDNIKTPNWQKLPGLLKQLDLQGNKICGVNTNQEVFCSTYKDGNWSKKGGLMDQISINNGKACGVTVNGDVFCADDINTMNWQKVDGILKQVDLDNTGKMCGVNGNGEVFCSNYKSGNWKNVGPSGVPGKYISIDNNTSFFVGKDGTLKSNGYLN